ncbi:MAG: PadR family transcriptional regulator [Actinomycetota bacterium]
MLEVAILGLLKQQPMHGYQLSRELGESLGGFWRVSYGSLYPTLRRLERDAFVEPEQGEGVGGRRKTVYRITEPGEQAFLELLQETPADSSAEDTKFRVRFAFFRYLQPETRIRLLERRRAFLEERLATIDASLRAHRGRADDYALALMEHGRAATESDVTWLDGLIRSEREKTNRELERGGTRTRRSAVLSRKEHTS